MGDTQHTRRSLLVAVVLVMGGCRRMVLVVDKKFLLLLFSPGVGGHRQLFHFYSLSAGQDNVTTYHVQGRES